MLTLITALSNDVQQYVRGGTNNAGLIHANNAAFAAFKTAIRCTAPRFVPIVNATQHMAFTEEGSIVSLEEDNDVEDLIEGTSEGGPFYLNDMRLHIKRSVDLLHEIFSSAHCYYYLLDP
jgi:hypothetical protein